MSNSDAAVAELFKTATPAQRAIMGVLLWKALCERMVTYEKCEDFVKWLQGVKAGTAAATEADL